MELTNKKQCIICNIKKNLDEFPKRKSSKDGRRNKCKVCTYADFKEKEYSSKWYKKQDSNQNRICNTEKKKEYCKKWYEKNKEEKKRKSSEYRKTQEGKQSKRLSNAKRRFRIATKDDGTINKDTLNELKTKQNNKCFYCDKELDWDKPREVNLDHYIPLNKGGSHSINNVVWACFDCNSTKRDEYPNKLLLI